MARNRNLHTAKVAKDDEYYTPYASVENELSHYKEFFLGKSVYCNCDNPTTSAFWKYFHTNFERLGLRFLVASYYSLTGSACEMVYAGGNDEDISTGISINLNGNGDFRSKECLTLLNDCDVCCSNPPFSLANEYISILKSSEKKFIVVGDLNWASAKEMFPLLKENKAKIGYTRIDTFITPDGTEKKFGNKVWYTNFDIKREYKDIPLTKKYSAELYPHYLNYDAIEVGRITDIPYDYPGIMGVPITIMQKLNPEQFDVIGISGYFGEYGSDAIGIKKIGDEWLSRYFSQGNTGHYTANMRVLVYYDKDGIAKSSFSRILIKNRRIFSSIAHD